MKKKLACCILSLTIIASTMTGCGQNKFLAELKNAQKSNTNIKIHTNAAVDKSEKNDITWVELDQLKTNETFRKNFDDALQIIKFDNSSKNGSIYVDLEGNWNGNNTLYNAFMNKYFMENFWNSGKSRTKIAELAVNEFSDVTNENTGIVASVNTYWNLLPTNKDGTSGLLGTVSRKEAMIAVCRADTPVSLREDKSEVEKLDSILGKTQYNEYIDYILKDSYLNIENQCLGYDSYNSAITRGEVIYMLMHRYFKDELDNVDTSGSPFEFGELGSTGLEKGYLGRNYCLEYGINTGEGCPKDIFKACMIAYNHGIIDGRFNWSDTLSGGYLVQLILNTYKAIYNKGFVTNAKSGENTGDTLLALDENREIKKISIGSSTNRQVRDVTDIDELLRVYGDEIDMTDEEIAEAKKISEDFTFNAADMYLDVAHCTWLNVRKGPSTDFSIIRSVPVGTKCHVVAVCKETGWYRVIADKKLVYQCGVYFTEHK